MATKSTKSNQPKWQKIPDNNVRQLWRCGTKHCGKHGEQITVDPSFYANSGLPICSECGNDLSYHGTEILGDCKNIARHANQLIGGDSYFEAMAAVEVLACELSAALPAKYRADHPALVKARTLLAKVPPRRSLRPAKITASQANPVVITVRSGVAEVASKPANVTVLIQDYDVQGIDAERLQQDAVGNSYIECVHRPTGAHD